MTLRGDDPRSSLSRQGIGPLGVLFAAAFVAAVVFVLDYGVLPPAFPERTVAPTEIRARLEFVYNDPVVLNRMRDTAAERAPRVYVEDPKWLDESLKDLAELFAIVEISSSPDDARQRAAHFPQDGQLVEDLYLYYRDTLGGQGKPLTGHLLERIRRSLRIIGENGILADKDLNAESPRMGGVNRFIVRISANQKTKNGDPYSIEVPVNRLNSISNAVYQFESATWRDAQKYPRALPEDSILLHIRTHLVHSLKFDPDRTEALREAARSAVGNGEIKVNKDDPILGKNQIITSQDYEKLHEEYRAYKRSLSFEERARHIAGLVTLTVGVLVMFLFAVSRLTDGLITRRRALVMLGILGILALAFARGMMRSGNSAALTPFVFVGMVASLAFGQAVSVMALIGLGVLTAFAGVRWEAMPVGGGTPALSLALMAGGIAASLPPEKLRDRLDLLKYGLLGGLIQGLLALGLSYLGDGIGAPSRKDVLLALANGPICGLFVLGLLPVIEVLFGILTNIRLYELADMNRPALRKIQLEAGGTWQHTLQVRFLAEPAAEAIGANSRLVVAGVLYHDIGKITKPEYFVENQMGAEERHRRLRPSVSALLITAHVKDGIEIATRDFHLPQQIVDFIPEHHGTTLVSYFYHSAKKNAENEAAGDASSAGVESVQEAFFRYPGPKPQSRETAIVMLADTVEAATRTLNNPSAARLRAFVHELIMDKMLDGQLDECDLTFADLTRIEEAFLRVLVTRFHSRVKYPGQDDGSDDDDSEPPPPPAAKPAEGAATAVIEMNPAVAGTLGVAAPPTASSRRENLTETKSFRRRPASAKERVGAERGGDTD